MLRAIDTTRYSPTAGVADYDWIDDALNRGQEEFVRQTRCLRTYALVELKANYRTYRLPWNFLDFMAAYYYSSDTTAGYAELGVVTIEELNDQVSDWRTDVDTPTHIYIDRIYGNNWMFGLYPIPDVDGSTITFDSEYGAITQWVCPNFTHNSEYGVVIRMTDTDEYFLNTDGGVVGKVGDMTGNVWLEYYRLPEKLIDVQDNLGVQGTQYPEIPREYQKALPYYTVFDLLMNNPEDSVEYRRAREYEQRFQREIDSFIGKRKKPLAGHNLQARANVWAKLNNMEYHNTLP